MDLLGHLRKIASVHVRKVCCFAFGGVAAEPAAPPEDKQVAGSIFRRGH